MNGKEEEPRIINSGYSQKQHFWISYAQSMCSKYTNQSLRDLLAKTTYHSPEEFRVNGALSNSPQFAEDFNCGDETYMASRKRCELW